MEEMDNYKDSKSFFRLTYEDEFQTVEKLYKTPLTVAIHTPVEMFAECLVAAGFHDKSVYRGFKQWCNDYEESNIIEDITEEI